jgi:DNA-binding SARP family transcriptional activator
MPDCQGRVSFHVRLLGRFQLFADEVVVLDERWPRKQAASILKMVALSRHRSLHRDRIAETLWAEMDGLSAANNLYKNLHHLRKVCRDRGFDSPLVIKAGNVALEDAVTVDVEEFRLAADAAISNGRDRKLFDIAIGAYGGELLPDTPYAEWSEAPRRHLRSAYVQLLLRAAQLEMEGGGVLAAVDSLEKALVEDTTEELVHRELMKAYALLGTPARAVQQYQACRDALLRRVGVEPSRETHSLYQRIVEGVGRAAFAGGWRGSGFRREAVGGSGFEPRIS